MNGNGGEIDDLSVIFFQRQIATWDNLEIFNIGDLGLTKSQINMIIEKLIKNKSPLRELNISYSDISSDKIINLINSKPTMKVLNLEESEIERISDIDKLAKNKNIKFIKKEVSEEEEF
jgi:hypothetical protein